MKRNVAFTSRIEFPPCYSDEEELEDFSPFLIIHLSTKAIAVPSAHFITYHHTSLSKRNPLPMFKN